MRRSYATTAAKPYRQGTVYSTRYAGLDFEHRGDHWRLLDGPERAGVGPFYRTRADLEAAVDGFAAARGYGAR
jgi:hypothetical protein